MFHLLPGIGKRGYDGNQSKNWLELPKNNDLSPPYFWCKAILYLEKVLIEPASD